MGNYRKDEAKKEWMVPTVIEMTEEEVLGEVPTRVEAGPEIGLPASR